MHTLMVLAVVLLVLVAVGRPHRIERGDLVRLWEFRRRDFRDLMRIRRNARRARRPTHR